jgi:D-lactate dehydrogenase (cytochrome)
MSEAQVKPPHTENLYQPDAKAVQAAIAELSAHFGDRISVSRGVRDEHGKGYSHHPIAAPDAVVFARSAAEVQRAVATCATHKVPMIPYGAGTSAHGQIAALRGGISIDLNGMDKVLELRPDDLDVVVQPGVRRKQLNLHLRDTGFFFPIDPGADASIGGMTSTRASGTNAVRYGTMRENVLSLEVVTARGEIIRTGSRAKKSAMGYDLTHLFVGAEGTLGVITEVTLRIHPIAEAISAAVCAFSTLKGAVDTAIAMIQSGIPVARVELLDEWSVRASNLHSNLTLKEAPTLFLEFHGTPAGVKEQAQLVRALAEDNGTIGFDWAEHQEDREKLWRARHDSLFATSTYWPGRKGFPTDACVPISALTDNILAARADMDASFLQGKIIGHVGDGNFHASYAIRPESAEDLAEAARLYDRVVERAIASGGTASGEHGVGHSMLRYMDQEHGAALGVMRSIKAALDPDHIMNPAKILPPV